MLGRVAVTLPRNFQQSLFKLFEPLVALRETLVGSYLKAD